MNASVTAVVFNNETWIINDMVILILRVIYSVRLIRQDAGFETAVTYFCFSVKFGFKPTLNRFICCLNIVEMNRELSQ